MGDLKWIRQNGLEAVITRMAGKGTPVIGVCGGFQMLGTSLDDPHGVEEGGTMRGMELSPIRTIFAEKKTRTRVTGTARFSEDGEPVKISGYEIHMGETIRMVEGISRKSVAVMELADTQPIQKRMAAYTKMCSEPTSTAFSIRRRCRRRFVTSLQNRKVSVRKNMRAE